MMKSYKNQYISKINITEYPRSKESKKQTNK